MVQGDNMSKMNQLEQCNYNIELVKDLGMRGTSPQRQRFAVFKCPTCAKDFETREQQIKAGTKAGAQNECRSCANTRRATTHGDSKIRLHRIWVKMIARTTYDSYIYHKGRGITVCDEWKDYLIFKEWALTNGYSDTLEIDRIDNDGNYTPNNCRWTTRNTQVQNTVILRKHNTSGYRGVTKMRNKWRARIVVNRKTIYLGVYNTPIEAGLAYNNYVIENSLAHTINNIKEVT